MSGANASRASIGDVRHIKHGDGARSNSRGLLRESMRELDQASWAYYASENPNVDVTRTHLNESFVNDGQGGWRRAKSIDEVIAYADSRRPREDGVREPGRVYRKLAEASYELTTIVIHLPRGLCHEEEWRDNEGRRKQRWVANDMDEARQYFADALGYLASDVLIGGQDAIHGYAENWDEHTPHIQIQCDPFGDDPKHPGYLKTYATEMWGTEKTPKDVAPKDVGARSGKEIGPQKMSRYHAGMRARMIDLGYAVEADVSDRSTEHEDKASWVEHQRGIEADYERLRRDRAELADRREVLDARESDLDARSVEVASQEGKAPELRRKAVDDGKAEGLGAAAAEMQAIVDGVRAKAAAQLELLAEQARSKLPSLFDEFLDRKDSRGRSYRPIFERFVDDRLKQFEAEHGVVDELVLDPGDREQFIEDGGEQLAADVAALQRDRQIGG